MDHCMKVERAVPTSKPPASHIVSKFMDNWLISYETSESVLTKIQKQFISKFCKSQCTILSTKHLKTTAYMAQVDW